MGFLEPAKNRKDYEAPRSLHVCQKPGYHVKPRYSWKGVWRKEGGIDLKPGDRWQCDDCGKIWIWRWVDMSKLGSLYRSYYDWGLEKEEKR